ncbi:helix-hairpin-helix domain-containing protein [Streptomyces sp. NPDC087440]|uniref:helix-hairpin-helix domain-containing protein n=1 Tax=Streptomyces sp. NPDC087440 TaxID=3365790 RepID=UPI00380FABFA
MDTADDRPGTRTNPEAEAGDSGTDIGSGSGTDIGIGEVSAGTEAPADSPAAPDAEAAADPAPEADAVPAPGADGEDEGQPDAEAEANAESGSEDAEDEAGTEDDGRSAAADSSAGDSAPDVAPSAEGDADDTAGTDAPGAGEQAPAAPQLSEAEAELAAQREFRAKIAQRKAEKAEISAGAKLSGTAADLMAAVKAVESGARPAAAFVPEPTPAPAPPRAVSAPVAAPSPAAPAIVPSQASTIPVAAGTVADVRGVLAAGGAPEALADEVARVLGEQAAQVLRDDPWQLLSVPGTMPEQADGFARALLGAECGPADGRRAAALVGWLLERAALKGHTAVTTEQVCKALAGFSVPDPEEAVAHALAEGVALALQDGSVEEPEAEYDEDSPEPEEEAEAEEPTPVLLGLDRYAMAEESLAEGLARLVNSPVEDAGQWEQLPGSAGDLVRAVAGHGLVAHTGGEASRAEPAALLSAAHRLGLRAYAATHSRDGRDRVAAVLHAREDAGDTATDTAWAVTLAGLLSGAEGPGRDADGALDLDLLVVFDAPQLDVETGAMLVEALPDGARLVLSGDPGVLPSAGAGQVFADVLSARACPQVASRTPDPGPIGELVSGIGIGELNQVEAPGKEVVIVPVRDAGEAVHRTVQLVADSVPRAFGIDAGHTQVITPGHGGSAGTRALNAALKQRLNPGPGRFGGFDAGDRIAYVPVPGRTVPGTVQGADADGLHLDCAGEPVVVPKERVEASVRHAWALTAHQAAGMRWPAVVVVLPGDAAQALTRPWVYTAFGRGERHLSVVHGVDAALPRAVAEAVPQPRTTRLAELLRPAPVEATA